MSPCYNGGVCSTVDSTWLCNCAAGFSGVNCIDGSAGKAAANSLFIHLMYPFVQSGPSDKILKPAVQS